MGPGGRILSSIVAAAFALLPVAPWAAQDAAGLPRAMAWSAYNLGTTGYNQAVAIGKVLKVDLPRPRDRKALLETPQFYHYRQEVLHFLAEYDHGPAAKAA